ncbi:hypothetical protein A6A06_39590 [Streptomyces sp. CB02923]|nr:hypothetical protein A6A06_39590 [Streptomyces sp. CB02923]
MLGFTWGRPLRTARLSRPATASVATDGTAPPPEVPPVSVSGRGISFEWGEPLEQPDRAQLLTWWVGHAQSASGWPSSYLETDDGQAEHVTHAVDWLYRSLRRLDVSGDQPLHLELENLRQARARQQYAECLSGQGSFLSGPRSSLTISVVTDDGVCHVLAIRCRATVVPTFAPTADRPGAVLVGGAV